MSRSGNTKTHNIFLLNKDKVQEKYFEGQETRVDSIIDRIIDEAPTRYEEQSLLENANTGGFRIRVFFHGEENANSKLASFCRPFIQPGQKILTFKPRSSSALMFIWSKTHVFAITSGQAFRIITEFCVPKFGMLVVNTFQQLFRITALDSNGMSSIVHSSKTIYANEIDFIDVDALDTVFKEVTGRLNDPTRVRNLLNLKSQSKKKSVKVTAKDYVQFSSFLDLQGLLHLLEQIDQYDYSVLQDRFNLVSPVSPKLNPAIVEQNDNRVIERMFEAVISDSSLGFDLFNRSSNDFIGADEYLLSIGASNILANTDDIEPDQFIKEAYTSYIDGDEPSLESFTHFVKDCHLISKKGDIIVTDDPLLKHISGEIEVNNKSYYIFYGEYYYLSAAYSERLNQSLKGKLQDSRFTNTITTIWNNGDKEDDFNRNVSNNEGYIHLHKILPEYIEFADLMKLDANGITIVHVKDGFNNDMRALDRQVEMSIARILDLKNNNNDSYMRKLYKSAARCTTGRNVTQDFANEDAFIAALKEKDIHYIIAIRPSNKDLLKNRSNIAKHCLNALILRCFNQGIDLKIDIL